MSCGRVLLSIILPPLAVIDKGCGAIFLVTLLTVLGWIPGVVGALVICSREKPTPLPPGPELDPVQASIPEQQERRVSDFPADPVVAQQESFTLTDRETEFLEGMTLWLQSNQYQVGVYPRNIKMRKQVMALKIAAGITKAALSASTGTFMWVSGGARADKVVKALTPIASLSDLIGLKIQSLTQEPHMILVIYADSLSPEIILHRLEQFLTLAHAVAKLGLRVNFQTVGLYIYPLAIYFEEQNYVKSLPVLLPQGWQRSFWKKLNLRVGFVNVPQRTVVWAEPTGPARIGKSLGGFKERFTEHDLSEVLRLGSQQSTND
jgi:uncharacterized membrane protein YqaE (UPF0057 family)